MIDEKYLNTIKEHQKYYPVKITKISKAFNINVYEVLMSENISGAIIKEYDKYIIYVNAADGRNRRRFTIAHEISHFILHKEQIDDNLTDNAMYRSRLSNVLERQANRLASEILMPAELVFNLLNKNKSISEMACLFEVSEEAMRIRLEQGGNIFLY